MQAYFLQVWQWVSQASSWFGKGPVWVIIGVLLAEFTLLQVFHESWAGGKLFSKKALWITLTLDAVWAYLVLALPFVPTSVTIALLAVAGLIIAAVASHKKWH